MSGEADPEGVAAGEPVFSPCDDIPDDALRAVGMDPATESRDIYGVKQPGWNICDWRGSGPYLTVFSTTHTLDDVRSNSKYTEFSSLEVSGREAISYREVVDLDRRSCSVAVGSADGAVLISLAYLGVDQVTEDPCLVAERTIRELIGYIPA
ncbi:DUF3558 domain-containing protein [Prescottella defluvii]|uniref:DUF3558 domain-containing protein n=1 Tax=Prescottella defluvii TaxID=1323361 RepID=UPI0039EB7C40